MGRLERGVGLAALVASLLMCAGGAEAGAWPKRPGEALTVQSLEIFETFEAERRFAQVLVRTYAERGLTDAVTIGGQLAHSEQEASGPGYEITASGVSEAELFATLAMGQRSRAVSAFRITGAFATSKSALGNRVMGQDAAIGPSWLLGIGSDRFFAEAETGYRRSLGGDADQLRFNAAAGLKRGEAILMAKTHHVRSVLPKDDDGLDFDLGQVALSAVLPLRPRLRVEVGGRADIYTRRTDPGAALFFSIWWTS